MTEHGLPPELVWRDDGHVTEEALVAIADAELSLVPDNAQRHVEACEECGQRLGEVALLSAQAHTAFAALSEQPSVAPARFPLIGVAAAVLLAALGLLPNLSLSLRELMSLPATALSSLLLLVRSVGVLLRHGFEGPVWVAAWCGAAVLLFIAGLIISRVAPRNLAWKGVVR